MHLLSIAVPTYNRDCLLSICLNSIVTQALPYIGEIEIIVCDNCSADQTSDIIKECKLRYPSLRSYKNNKNKGPDYNIKKCYEMATSKYIWIFSDDDLLLPNAIKRLIPFLRGHDFSVVTLQPNFYRDKINIQQFDTTCFEYDIFSKPMPHIALRHYWLTYITGVIVNKQALNLGDISYPDEDSFLIQLGWILPALFTNNYSVFIRSSLILGRSLSVLDFKLFYVFGCSYPKVLRFLERSGKIPREARHLLIRLIITNYFPSYIQPAYSYTHGERPLLILTSSFWNRPLFWRVLIPLFIRRTLMRSFRRIKSIFFLHIRRKALD